VLTGDLVSVSSDRPLQHRPDEHHHRPHAISHTMMLLDRPSPVGTAAHAPWR